LDPPANRVGVATSTPWKGDALGTPIPVVVVSFGYLHPCPSELDTADLVEDVRKRFRDPHHDPRFRELTGLDAAVRQRVLRQPGVDSFLARLATRVMRQINGVSGGARPRAFTVAIGCAGGRHRSVVLAGELAGLLTRRGVAAEVRHLHIHLPVVAR
jgi:RNase adaptor protein for sRNA GlmZ degradation